VSTDPDAATGGEATHKALVIVAVRAIMLREVVRRDWGGHEDAARDRAFDYLLRALDDLELAEPGVHAQMHEAVERILTDWREAFGEE
jgi:hypothetical protein